jgi:hypothetical protein
MHDHSPTDDEQAEVSKTGIKQKTTKGTADNNDRQEDLGAFQNGLATTCPSSLNSVDQTRSDSSSLESLLSTVSEGISTFDSLLQLYDSLLDEEPVVKTAEVTAPSELTITSLDELTEHASSTVKVDHNDEDGSESLLEILRDVIQTMDSLVSIYDSMLEDKDSI